MGQLEKYGLYVLVVVIVMILGVALMGGDPAVTPGNDLAVADTHGVKLPGDGPGVSKGPGASKGDAHPVGSNPSEPLFSVFHLDDSTGGGFIDASAEGSGSAIASGGNKAPSTEPNRSPVESREQPASKLGSNGALGKADPSPEKAPKIAPEPIPKDGGQRRHLIAPGETLSSIADHYYGDPNQYDRILAANPGLMERRLPQNKEIVIPPAPAAKKSTGGGVSKSDPAVPQGARTHKIVADDTLSSIAKTYYGAERHWQRIKDANPDVDERRMPLGRVLIIPAPPAEVVNASVTSVRSRVAPKGAVLHVIQDHETLSQISQRYYHTDHEWQRILDANPGLDPGRLRIGTEIVIPGVSADRSL